MKLLIKTGVLLFTSLFCVPAQAETCTTKELHATPSVSLQKPVVLGICTGVLITSLQELDTYLAKSNPQKTYTQLGSVPAALCAGGVVLLVSEIASIVKANPDYKFTTKSAAKVILALAACGLLPLYLSNTSATGQLLIETTKNISNGVVNGGCALAEAVLGSITRG